MRRSYGHTKLGDTTPHPDSARMRAMKRLTSLRLAPLTIALMVMAAACSDSAVTSTTQVSSAESSTTTTGLGPGAPTDFEDLGLATVLPAGWVLETESLAHGSAAMLFDAGDTAALVILGRGSELDEPIVDVDPTTAALAVSNQLAEFFFGDGAATVMAADVTVVSGAEAAISEFALDHADGTRSVTRTIAISVDDGIRFATLLYQEGFPADRVAQGLAVLSDLSLLD